MTTFHQDKRRPAIRFGAVNSVCGEPRDPVEKPRGRRRSEANGRRPVGRPGRIDRAPPPHAAARQARPCRGLPGSSVEYTGQRTSLRDDRAAKRAPDRRRPPRSHRVRQGQSSASRPASSRSHQIRFFRAQIRSADWRTRRCRRPAGAGGSRRPNLLRAACHSNSKPSNRNRGNQCKPPAWTGRPTWEW